MEILQNKIDFALVIAVHRANPNGDPLNGNRPRETYEGYGEISDVCLKRKIRNRLMDLGASVFVQSDDRRNDGFHSLKERADACPALSAATKANPATPWAPSTGWDLLSTPPSAASTASWRKRPDSVRRTPRS